MLILRIATMLIASVSVCVPAVAQIYETLPWYEIDPASDRVGVLFPEAAGLLEMDLTPPKILLADIAHPDGPLTFAMWVGPGMCGLINCGLKIFDAADAHLGGAEVCSEPVAIKIDPTSQFVRLCSDTASPIASLFWNQPAVAASANSTAPATAISVAVAPAAWQAQEVVHMNHNGSVMAVAPAEGTITYVRVRDGLRDSVADGTVLFRGEPWQAGAGFGGTAYTFRKGCAPAGYAVRASYEGPQDVLTLRGDAPMRVRNGCQVTGYSGSSGNAVLEFNTTFD